MSVGASRAIEREAVTVARPRGVLRIAVEPAMLEVRDQAERDPEVGTLVPAGAGRAFSVGPDDAIERQRAFIEKQEPSLGSGKRP